ncbi:MAG: ATP-binding protein [Lachnospiraceae bacterium]|nr:ATP-binding protein [Lachnospiraceae bacterium]
MKNNPFNLDFGAKPDLYIPRVQELNKIVDTFKQETPSTHLFMLIGARGTGKTVLMTEASHRLRDEKGWIHIDLNSESNLLELLASRLYKDSSVNFSRLKLDMSIKGIGVSYEKEEKYSNIQVDLDTMIKELDKKHYRLLITIDEIFNSKDIREFTSYYQHCIREKLPVFVLMTGLYKNIRALQNNRSQTFLRRAPRIELGPLNELRVANQYKSVFKVDDKKASIIADQTDGYSYAFQILGYIMYEMGKTEIDEDVLSEYKINLFEASYEKIWEEMSEGERKLVKTLSEMDGNPEVKDVRDKAEMDSNTFSTYRDTLVKSGILSKSVSYGRTGFCLPFFKEFVAMKEFD